MLFVFRKIPLEFGFLILKLRCFSPIQPHWLQLDWAGHHRLRPSLTCWVACDKAMLAAKNTCRPMQCVLSDTSQRFFFWKAIIFRGSVSSPGCCVFWWGGANYSKQYTGLAGGILPTWLESWLWDRGCRTSRNWKMKHESNNWINWTFTHQSSTDYQTLVSNVEHQALQQLMLDPPKGQAELGWKKTWLVSIRWTEDPQSGSFPAWGNMSHVGHKRPFCKTLVTLLWDPILFENKIWVFVCNVKLPIIKTISCLVNSLDLLLVFSHNYLFWLSYKAQPQANKWSIERKTTVLHQTGSSI